MKKSILLIAIIAFCLKSNAYVFTSSNGYDVNVEITLDSLTIVSSGCADGWYNFGIAYSFDISFSGTNAPSSMWTLQANSIGDDGSTFMKLPNNGGQGGYTSSTITRRYSDCGSATPSSLGFDTIYLDIQGPGLSKSKFPLHVSALPVELLYFNATLQNRNVQLNWATASEINNDYFTIEKSMDGLHFEAIQTVYGAGNSLNKITYEANDLINESNVVYYRLKQTDFDGSYSYSKIVVVKSSLENAYQISAFPNPNSGGNVKVNVGESFYTCSITVSSIDGKIIEIFKPVSQISELEDLTRGVYVVTVFNKATGEKQSIRLIQE